MKSLIVLWSEIANEYGDLCNVCTTRDLETVMGRVEGEGLSFLTISLPKFASDFQLCLAQKRVTPNMFLGFSKHAGLPRFLGGFLELIFDRASGTLLSTPRIDAIQAVRQLTLVYGKLEVAASDRRCRAAIRQFVECEQEIKRADSERDPVELSDFRRMSSLLWREVLSQVENDLYAELNGSPVSNRVVPHFVPHHGPGATADRRTGNGKFDLREWSSRLERIFPFGEYALPSWRYHKLQRHVDFREPGAERPVRVITVPKTLKTPRIIAIEPSYMQYMQQGLKDMIVDAIRNDSVMGGMVGFDDQWRNRVLAEKGSLTGDLATLDLSEASDRVSNSLVIEMLAKWPLLSEAVQATRSVQADVPGHGVLPLTKFASMGSALTFPVEAMVFATVVFLGIEKSLGTIFTRAGVNRYRKQVRVYGDDLIVPTHSVESVITALELFGFKVNVSKSFFEGNFRESCGREFFLGHDVSVVRVRKVVPETKDGRTVYGLPASRRFVLETESTVALRNRFYLSGLWRVAKWLDQWNETLLRGSYPTIPVATMVPGEEPSPRSPLLGRWTVLPIDSFWLHRDATHPSLHGPKSKGYVVRPLIPSSTVSGVGALLKTLAPGRVDPFLDAKHLERAGRPKSVRMKLRWTQV